MVKIAFDEDVWSLSTKRDESKHCVAITTPSLVTGFWSIYKVIGSVCHSHVIADVIVGKPRDVGRISTGTNPAHGHERGKVTRCVNMNADRCLCQKDFKYSVVLGSEIIFIVYINDWRKLSDNLCKLVLLLHTDCIWDRDHLFLSCTSHELQIKILKYSKRIRKTTRRITWQSSHKQQLTFNVVPISNRWRWVGVELSGGDVVQVGCVRCLACCCCSRLHQHQLSVSFLHRSRPDVRRTTGRMHSVAAAETFITVLAL